LGKMRRVLIKEHNQVSATATLEIVWNAVVGLVVNFGWLLVLGYPWLSS
jgi:hypothetical protein